MLTCPCAHRRDSTTTRAAKAYLTEAVTHLVEDKGFNRVQRSDVDLCFEKEGRRFFVEWLRAATTWLWLRRRS